MTDVADFAQEFYGGCVLADGNVSMLGIPTYSYHDDKEE